MKPSAPGTKKPFPSAPANAPKVRMPMEPMSTEQEQAANYPERKQDTTIPKADTWSMPKGFGLTNIRKVKTGNTFGQKS
jgi:hypothetical protein